MKYQNEKPIRSEELVVERKVVQKCTLSASTSQVLKHSSQFGHLEDSSGNTDGSRDQRPQLGWPHYVFWTRVADGKFLDNWLQSRHLRLSEMIDNSFPCHPKLRQQGVLSRAFRLRKVHRAMAAAPWPTKLRLAPEAGLGPCSLRLSV